MFGLNDQYENHPYVEEFTKQCNVMFAYGTYALEGQTDSKFEWYMEFISRRSFTKQQLLQANDKLYGGIELHTKNIRSSTEHRDHQANT